MKYLPDGDNFANCGVSPAIRLKSSNVKDTPASCAMAGKCKAVLEEPPNAISTATAFSKASFVNTSFGRKPSCKTSITCMPARFARRKRSE